MFFSYLKRKFRRSLPPSAVAPTETLRVALIHSDKKISTGAAYINDLISKSLSQKGVKVRHFYPRHSLLDSPTHLKGLNNILFFHSLLEKHRTILSSSDLIQGTTYTPLAFLSFPIPVVSHFGSTTNGFLKAVPQAIGIDEKEAKKTWYMLRKEGALKELNIRNRRALRDVAEIEVYVASQADGVIATSEIVKNDLVNAGVDSSKIRVIPNAIEDYWFEQKPQIRKGTEPAIVYLGRLGSDAFTLQLKGVDRLCALFLAFPKVEKVMVGMTTNEHLTSWMMKKIPSLTLNINEKKEGIPELLSKKAGGILFIPSRYEGFSLSLIEGMSQGLVPIVYRVGIAPEIIVNGENGYLVSSVAEAKKMTQYLLENEDERLAMARKAVATARKFTTQKMAEDMRAFYDEVLVEYENGDKQKER
jgi:glycosyltransferase involved in cell wall biosynthesis